MDWPRPGFGAAVVLLVCLGARSRDGREATDDKNPRTGPGLPDGGFFNADDDGLTEIDGAVVGEDRVAVDNDEFTLVPSCNTTSGLAYPPRRIVEVARGLGEASVARSARTTSAQSSTRSWRASAAAGVAPACRARSAAGVVGSAAT